MPSSEIEPVAVSSSTIVDVICERASTRSHQDAFQFERGTGAPPRALTYAQLDREARRIAAWLQQQGLRGERVLIAQPQDLEYITSLLGCLYAGSIAVPLFPPKLNRHLHRLQLIIKDAAPRAALTSSSVLTRLQAAAREVPELENVQWATLEDAYAKNPEGWRRPTMAEREVALLQYTSGSTGDPRGVMLSHANLIANLKMIQTAFRIREDSVIVGWLPLYHDMGLIGNILGPLWAGARCILMPPGAFVEHPLRWLKLISDSHGTISGGPNFAYELCVQRIPPDDRRLLDLSSWQTAFTGSEPVRHETLERFAQTFSRCGFKAASWFPCYGLAEATLFVSGSTRNEMPRAAALPTNGNQCHNSNAPEDGTKGTVVVSCGRASMGQEILIVDPDTLQICPPHHEGEVWVAGPNVALGYWKQEEATDTVFRAFLHDGRGPFLRTGDLAFMSADQELFLTGRLKDLLIIRGQNHHPQDLEYSVQKSHPAFQGGKGAAFAIDVDGQTEIVLLQEIAAKQKKPKLSELIEAANRSLAEEHEIKAYVVGLLKAGALPITTSGKIRRRECKRQFLNRQLHLLAVNRSEFARSYGSGEEKPETNGQDGYPEVLDAVRSLAAQVLGVPATELDAEKPLTVLGMDSIQAMDLKAKIARRWTVDLSWETILDGPTLTRLAAAIVAKKAGPHPERPRRSDFTESDPLPLSIGQRAQWFLYKVAPANAAYNIPIAMRIRGEMDLGKIKAAFQFVIARHASLRTQFKMASEGALQEVISSLETPLTIVPAQSWTEDQLAAHMRAEVSRPFKLEEAPLFRIVMYIRDRLEHVLVFVVHHAVTDFQSLVMMLEELQNAYGSLQKGIEPQLPLVEHTYADFVVWQQKMLASQEGERLKRYWQEELRGELPVLKLPIDRPRQPIQTYAGSTQRLTIGQDMTRKLLSLSAARQSTLFSLLAATFMTLLHRYTSQQDIVIGTPVSGRTQAQWSNVSGHLVNQVVLRARFKQEQRFSELWDQVSDTVKRAIVNQDYPLALVADQIHPERDPAYPPLFQTMFSFHRVTSDHGKGIAALAVGESGYSIDWGKLHLESVPISQNVVQLDLTLAIGQIGDELVGSLQYNTDLFDQSTIVRMAAHFTVLLESVISDVDLPISELSLLTQEEERLLHSWNRTALDYDPSSPVHALFAEQARVRGDRTAVILPDQVVTYSELDRRANQLAHYLISLGAQPDLPIGLCLDRSADMMVGLLGILKAGAPYLPIDPAQPDERIEYILRDSQTRLVVTQSTLSTRLGRYCPGILFIDTDSWIAKQDITGPATAIDPESLAYVIYTSASTGKPKGVMISHRSVVNFMQSMDNVIGCGPEDTMLAVTSMAFDISVLELLWTLSRGARVLLADVPRPRSAPATPSRASHAQDVDYSLSYFASANEQQCNGNGKYDLLVEGTKFADKNGLAAVWTPERHFHRFGGLYPNPAVTSAALASITDRIHLRAGSVVLPLHNVLRVAEEWSVVDNLSGGRTGIAFASGWHADDFVLAPQNYTERKEVTFRSIDIFLKLWQGQPVKVQSGSGKDIEVAIFPKPIQRKPPIWITAAGTPDTFIRAGQLGANVLTHLLGQSLEDLSTKITLYRDSLNRAGHSPEAGRVTLMLHTFIGEDLGRVKDIVRKPFTEYLRSSIDLIRKFAVSANLAVDLENIASKDMDDLLKFAFDRYFDTSALFGTVASCAAMVEKLEQLGINEIACLVDFGVDTDAVLGALSGIAAIRQQRRPRQSGTPPPLMPSKTLIQLSREYAPTLMQCTPTMLQALELATDNYSALRSLRVLILGGEPLSPSLARTVKSTLPCRLVNMYGPTETTIWSSTEDVDDQEESISIGRPIGNTEFYVLDVLYSRPVPVGVTGELYIGGHGLARGYLNRPGLTAEQFIPDEFSGRSATRLYRTGDLARYLSNGKVALLGRRDNQVKIRGVRIELGEIEFALVQHPQIKEAAVLAQGDRGTARELVAYLVAGVSEPPTVSGIRDFLKSKLPEVMVPSRYVFLGALPLNTNGKLDRQALGLLQRGACPVPTPRASAVSEQELLIAEIWKEVLELEVLGIDENFFDLGGHSLRMIQVQGRLSARLCTEIPLITLLEHPTIRSLARHLAQHGDPKSAQQEENERASRKLQALLRNREEFSAARRSVP